MTVAGVADPTSEVFADILCSDPEWVDAEFEQIVSGFTDEPTITSTPPRSPSFAIHSIRRPEREPWSDRRWTEKFATIRAPPSSPGRHARRACT